MSIPQLEPYCQRVEAALAAYLDAATRDAPERLRDSMRYAVLQGGKRLRPCLCLAAAEAAEGDPATAIPAAAAVEFLHAYSLIHDDLPAMDNDDVRRGMPTCHRRFGEAHAILAGDALQALAFGVLAAADLPPETTVRLLRELAAAAGPAGITGGQSADLTGPDESLTATRLDYIHQHKTADLFRCACRLGAIAVGADDDRLTALTDYGNALGHAFQLIDDLLDADETGAADHDQGSSLRVHGRADVQRMARDATEQAAAAAASLGAAGAPLAALATAILERTV